MAETRAEREAPRRQETGAEMGAQRGRSLLAHESRQTREGTQLATNPQDQRSTEARPGHEGAGAPDSRRRRRPGRPGGASWLARE